MNKKERITCLVDRINCIKRNRYRRHNWDLIQNLAWLHEELEGTGLKLASKTEDGVTQVYTKKK